MKRQIILIEQKEKMPDIIKEMCRHGDGKSVKIIEFTKDQALGHYGLLPEMYD